MNPFDPIQNVVPDGQIIPDVGSWAVFKYNLVGHYCNIFTSSMKNKWERLVYLDLFAGAGYASIRGTNTTLKTSALIAMSTPNPFHHFILSEYETDKCDALQERINRHHPGISHTLYRGNTNANIDAICSELDDITRRYSTLCYCFVDPFSLNLHFSTIRKLTAYKVDFLILLAIHMDFKRNLGVYYEENNEQITNFLGNTNWRNELKVSPDKQEIIKFLSVQYDKNMLSLNYEKPIEKQLIKSDNKKIPLYYLAFYSRHQRGNEFFNKLKIHGQGKQLSLF